MVINNLIELIEKLFYGNYENISIVDISERSCSPASKMTIGQLKNYDIRTIDGIVIDNERILIKIN